MIKIFSLVLNSPSFGSIVKSAVQKQKLHVLIRTPSKGSSREACQTHVELLEWCFWRLAGPVTVSTGTSRSPRSPGAWSRTASSLSSSPPGQCRRLCAGWPRCGQLCGQCISCLVWGGSCRCWVYSDAGSGRAYSRWHGSELIVLVIVQKEPFYFVCFLSLHLTVPG